MEAFKVEKDWITVAGLRAVVIRFNETYRSHRCGYVGITKDHPLFGVDYTEAAPCLIRPQVAPSYWAPSPESVIEAHGGITFAGGDKYPLDADLWWYGFDCAHVGDDDEGGRTLKYCENQCESMAGQLIQIHNPTDTLEAENERLREDLEALLPSDPSWDFTCPNSNSQGCAFDEHGLPTERITPTADMKCPNCGTPIDDSHRKARAALKDNGEKE